MPPRAAAKQADFFSVRLHTPEGRDLPSIQYDDGQQCFVGEPGDEYHVTVTGVLNSGRVADIYLYVDGSPVGYAKIMKRSRDTTFRGWLRKDGVNSKSYSHFKFGSADSQAAATTVSSADELQAGKIEVKIWQVKDTGRRKPHRLKTGIQKRGPSKAASNRKLPEGKKWFLAPGLKTEKGSVSTSNTGWTTRVYEKIGSLPSLKVRYDSSEALFLRKALNPRFAPHRAILRRSANPAIRALAEEPSSSAAAAAAAPAAAAAAGSGRQSRVKRERGRNVKREQLVEEEEQQEDDFVVPKSATAERIDLTEEPVRPMTINGRQLAPDELAVCDLCDSDEEEQEDRDEQDAGGADGAAARGGGAKWRIAKKQRIVVDV